MRAGLRVAFLFAAGLAMAAAAQTPSTFDSSRAWEHLRQLVALGPRPAGSPAIGQTRAYIEAQLKTSGVAFTEQAWDDQTPAGPIHMVNVIATIPGASPSRLVIAGHYDTKRFRQFRFVGANDGGSSAAFVLELARVLKARRNPLTIELLFLDGEEAVDEWRGTDHTYGSRHYVAEARRTGTLASLKALILVDMIADRDLRIRRDLNSTRWLTDIVWDAARRVNQSSVFIAESTEIEDDHLPFVQAGVPSLDIIDLEYPAWHTAQDTLDAVSARSMQTVGDVLIAALPAIEQRLTR
ncbi:MAG TPA: M28 family peptidase [Vicinamibacterales bacterium]|jgi:Zn-dependent M28 family amino/carboxypeptidase